MSGQLASDVTVTTHVGRDLLQSAGLFKHDRLVVWEYVSNGLQYVDQGTNPLVRVKLDKKHHRIVIEDNGRGMDLEGLKNYFVMHGENLDRKSGRGGRGRFGTGKSAAFGIADTLRITTVHDGKRSKVELTRERIESVENGQAIPLKLIEQEVPTNEPNGTVVEIEDIKLRRFDRTGIIKYIERHLSKWRGGATVFVNNHECEYYEPPVASEYTFKPEGDLLERLGDVRLLVKVSTAPLDPETRGVDILSNGVWHESTLGSAEGKEISDYIFGELDVQALEEDDSSISPFDQSRSMELNPNNPIVRAIHAFTSQGVEQVRKELVAAEKERRKSAEAQRLQETADQIAEILNEDFTLFRRKLAKVRARGVGATDAGPKATTDGQADDLVFGDEVPATIDGDVGGEGSSGEGNRTGGEEPRLLNPTVRESENEAQKQGRRVGGEGQKKRSAGGFRVQFEHMGEEEPRAKYIRDHRMINVNLDHPQLKAAKGNRATDDPMFQRLAYEVAAAEYSIAIHLELALADEYLDLTDPIFDIQETMDRISRKTAPLYAELV